MSSFFSRLRGSYAARLIRCAIMGGRAAPLRDGDSAIIFRENGTAELVRPIKFDGRAMETAVISSAAYHTVMDPTGSSSILRSLVFVIDQSRTMMSKEGLDPTSLDLVEDAIIQCYADNAAKSFMEKVNTP